MLPFLNFENGGSMWLCDFLKRKNERKNLYLNKNEKYIMAVLWKNERDLSVYEIMEILYKHYEKRFVSPTIERLIFQLSQKAFVQTYIQNHILLVQYLVAEDIYFERIRQEVLRLQKSRIWGWEESYDDSLTEEEAQELRELLDSFEDGEE